MGFTEDTEIKVKDLLDGNYEKVTLDYVPTVDNVSLGKKYVYTQLCALFIDLRNSSELLINKWKQTSAKIHKAYVNVVVDTVKEYGGKVRSFQGDGVLSFWPGYKQSQLTNAVKAAMTIKWLLDKEFKKLFQEYFDIDFGIGIDFDETYVIKAGSTDKKENNDLIYITKAVNKAVKLANIQKRPYHIGITERTYSNLEKNWIKDKEGKNMWRENNFNWTGTNEKYRESNYQYQLR